MQWSTEDWHTAGEPFRIVRDVPTNGTTVAERRVEAMHGEANEVRRFLCLDVLTSTVVDSVDGGLASDAEVGSV